MNPSSSQWIILPSEKAAERKRRELFIQSDESAWLGETVFSLPHFLKKVTAPEKPILTRNLQKHLIYFCLKKFPLRYFGKLQHVASLSGLFLAAIRQLKHHGISPEKLEPILAEAGSLKENDLLKTYEHYEKLKTELGVFDEEDLTFLPMTHATCREIVFENFFEKPLMPAFNMPVSFQTPSALQPAGLKQAELLSFPSPHQETDWFLGRIQKLLSQGTELQQIGILTGGSSKENDRIWKKLRRAGIVEGETPFLSWRQRPEGRMVLVTAEALELEEATLTDWLEVLLEKIGATAISPLIESFYFLDHALDIGELPKREWMAWLQENLEQKEPIRIPNALEGLQWIDLHSLNGGDLPSLHFLWVPGMIEGNFPTINPSPFFQDKKDRSRKEWKTICQAFPDPQDLFEKKRLFFLAQLSKAKKTWLTFPRCDSFGREISPSPFTWDFRETENVPEVAPLFFGEESGLEEKIKIEKERIDDNLQTDPFHANFKNDPLLKKLEPAHKEHIFSPSRLETYAACPFRYFADRILNIPRDKEYSPQVDAEDRGTLFHNCIEKLLSENGNLFLEARTDPEKEKKLYEVLSHVVETVFGEMAEQLAYANPELYRHLQEKTLEQATQLLQNELKEARSLPSPLKPAYFEWGFGTTKENSLQIGDVYLGGRIDRIDVDEEAKHFLILDYKTGQSSFTKFREKLLEGLALQLPIYVLAVKKLLLKSYGAVGGLLISVRSGEKKQGIVDDQFNKTHFTIHKTAGALLETEEFEKKIETTMETIRQYVEQIRAGYFSAQPKDCRASCDYKDICRYPLKPFE